VDREDHKKHNITMVMVYGYVEVIYKSLVIINLLVYRESMYPLRSEKIHMDSDILDFWNVTTTKIDFGWPLIQKMMCLLVSLCSFISPQREHQKRFVREFVCHVHRTIVRAYTTINSKMFLQQSSELSFDI